MRIALFTPFSPEIGGGSVQLRSHLEQMPELQVEWYYLSGDPVCGEHRHWLGKPVAAWQFAADLAFRCGSLSAPTRRIKEIADQMSGDLYWIVAHYEGISLAAELLSHGKRVHLTVHDEPLAMLIRSRRFRALWPLMALTFSRVLRGASSVDVTSTAMRDYLNQKYGSRAFALYKHVPALLNASRCSSPHTLTIGHIGSLYHPDPFRRFLTACRAYANMQNRALKIIRIGHSPAMDQVAAEDNSIFEDHGELLEQNALPVLARCDFLYAMYPEGFRFRGFRRTSLPIKLSTYIQAQRPILAHTPLDSGLAQLVSKYQVGTVCSSQKPQIIQEAISAMLERDFPRTRFETLRADLMGEGQLEQLRAALSLSNAVPTRKI